MEKNTYIFHKKLNNPWIFGADLFIRRWIPPVRIPSIYSRFTLAIAVSRFHFLSINPWVSTKDTELKAHIDFDLCLDLSEKEADSAASFSLFFFPSSQLSSSCCFLFFLRWVLWKSGFYNFNSSVELSQALQKQAFNLSWLISLRDDLSPLILREIW